MQGDRTVLDCGTLVVDDLSFSACPDVLTIGAVARPNGTSFHEKNREQVWKNTSIKRIAETIAGRYGLECKMDAEDVSVALKEQDDNDSSFLQKICSTYGLILKTYRNKIWIFDREKYKKKDSVATDKPIDICCRSCELEHNGGRNIHRRRVHLFQPKEKSEYQGDNRNGRPDVEAKPVCIK